MRARIRIDRFRRQLAGDHLIRNSLWLALTAAATGAFGFAFWLVAARLYTPGQVGLATSLVSATSLIAYLGLLGFNSSFVRYLPTSSRPYDQISTGLLLCCGAATLAALAYLGLLPVISSRLDFIRHSPVDIVIFVIGTAAVSVNLLTDSVFIAYRKAQFNFLIDGVIQSATKLALPALLVGMGAFGLFASMGVAAAVAVVASLLALWWTLAYRPSFIVHRPSLRTVAAFSAASYTSSLLNLIPLLVLPLIVLDGSGADAAGYFYIAFQVATLLNTGCFAVTESLLAEGSQPGADIAAVARHGARVVALLVPPAALVTAGAAPFVLGLFGHSYRTHATGLLVVLSLSALTVAFNNWSSVILKVTRHMRPLVASNVAYAVVIIGLSLWWRHRGLIWIGLAWTIGNLVSGAWAAVALTRTELRPARRAPLRQG